MFRFKLSGFVHWGKLPPENLSKSELYSEPAERRRIPKKTTNKKKNKKTQKTKEAVSVNPTIVFSF